MALALGDQVAEVWKNPDAYVRRLHPQSPNGSPMALILRPVYKSNVGQQTSPVSHRLIGTGCVSPLSQDGQSYQGPFSRTAGEDMDTVVYLE
jgi:hypothetical protein